MLIVPFIYCVPTQNTNKNHTCTPTFMSGETVNSRQRHDFT